MKLLRGQTARRVARSLRKRSVTPSWFWNKNPALPPLNVPFFRRKKTQARLRVRRQPRMQMEIKWRLPSTSSSKVLFFIPISHNLSFDMQPHRRALAYVHIFLNPVQVGQAGRGRWVQRWQRTNQLSVLLRSGPRRDRAGREAVIAADQRHAKTLPGRRARVLTAPPSLPVSAVFSCRSPWIELEWHFPHTPVIAHAAACLAELLLGVAALFPALLSSSAMPKSVAGFCESLLGSGSQSSQWTRSTEAPHYGSHFLLKGLCSTGFPLKGDCLVERWLLW